MKLFPQVTPDEHTHTNQAGAELNARWVIAGLKSLPQNPLAPYFSAKAAEVTPSKGVCASGSMGESSWLTWFLLPAPRARV